MVLVQVGLLLLYLLIIMAVSLAGGYLPLARRISHLDLQVYLSLSAGAMIGAAFFHMMPEAAHLCGDSFGLWMAVGVIGLYMLERFVSPHSHDIAEAHEHGRHHAHGASCAADAKPAHAALGQGPSHHSNAIIPAAPRVGGWSAIAGLFVHTLLGGAALGSAVLGAETPGGLGTAVFLATVLHKPADSFTISTILIRAGTSLQRAMVVQVLFVLMLPAGVLLFLLGQSVLSSQAILEGTTTGAVLAFSAGTFLCISLADLLPEVQFHSHDRFKLAIAVLIGALVMWGTSLLEHGAHHH